MTVNAPSPLPASAGDEAHVQLSIEGLRLLIPQSNVTAVEPMFDVAGKASDGGHVGWIDVADRRIPVFSLSPGLRLRKTLPEASRIYLVLRSRSGPLALVCDWASKVAAGSLRRFAVPRCMRQDSSPLTGLVVLDGVVGCLTDADELVERLSLQAVVSTFASGAAPRAAA